MNNQVSFAPQTGLLPLGVAKCILLGAVGSALTTIPKACWWWCWLSSIYLLFSSLTGTIFATPKDVPFQKQALRPWILVNVIFVSYGFLTSIFYWLDLNGFRFTTYNPSFVKSDLVIEKAAIAQYLYLIGHIGFLLGLGMFQKWSLSKSYRLSKSSSLPLTAIQIAVAAFVATFAFWFVPGLSQFAEKAQAVFTVSTAVSFGLAYQADKRLLPIAGLVNSLLLLLALSSGWKEGVLVLVILNGISFFPIHPKTTMLLATILFLFGFVVLPPIANEVREKTWNGNTSRWEALSSGLEEIQSKPIEELVDDSWEFLTNRLSEEGLFVRYIESVPEHRPFYGTQIIQQAAITPIPRIIWPEKEITERVVHQRVVENGVVSSLSQVSAKPQFVVDGYLSFGITGVFVAMFTYGALAQILSVFSEHYLGGYLVGGIFFNGLFSFLWRGACFEFYFNALVWSAVSVVLLNLIGSSIGWLQRTK